MRIPKTLEEARVMQQHLDAVRDGNDAYADEETRWKASRFAMDILREISLHNGQSAMDTYNYLQSTGSIENYVLKHYDIMHTQDLKSTVCDVEEYAREHSHAF